jgi:hypothetical protein
MFCRCLACAARFLAGFTGQAQGLWQRRLNFKVGAPRIVSLNILGSCSHLDRDEETGRKLYPADANELS